MTTPVEPVQAKSPTTGLIPSTGLTPGSDWMRGLSWRPETCITYQGFGPCDLVSGVPAVPNNLARYYFPPGYRVRDTCTTRGGVLDTDRLRRQADAIASYVVAHELWTGELSRADPGDVSGTPTVNPYLADGNAVPVTVGALSIVDRIGLLEATARDASRGQQVFLHVPERFILGLGAQLRRSGNLLLTPLDSVVISDAGYPGSGDFVAATGEVQSVTVTGGPTGGTFTLTYSGQTTGTIAFNAAASVVQTALIALSNLNPGDVTVSGANGGPYSVSFAADLGNPPQMTASGAGLTGGTTPGVTVATTTPFAAASTEAGTWAYATGPVQVRLSDLELLDDLSSTVMRDINSQEIWAERLFAATFDPCVHFSAQLI